MANIEQIDKANLPAVAKEYLKLEKSITKMSSEHDDQYLFRILIDKVNELTRELNIIKSALGG